MNSCDKMKCTQYIDEKKHNELQYLYKNANEEILRIIDIIFEIGTRDLYSSIVNNSPDTIKYLQEIINIMKRNNIKLPDITILKKYHINENEGWGREFTKEDIFNEKL